MKTWLVQGQGAQQQDQALLHHRARKPAPVLAPSLRQGVNRHPLQRQLPQRKWPRPKQKKHPRMWFRREVPRELRRQLQHQQRPSLRYMSGAQNCGFYLHGFHMASMCANAQTAFVGHQKRSTETWSPWIWPRVVSLLWALNSNSAAAAPLRTEMHKCLLSAWRCFASLVLHYAVEHSKRPVFFFSMLCMPQLFNYFYCQEVTRWFSRCYLQLHIPVFVSGTTSGGGWKWNCKQNVLKCNFTIIVVLCVGRFCSVTCKKSALYLTVTGPSISVCKIRRHMYWYHYHKFSRWHSTATACTYLF